MGNSPKCNCCEAPDSRKTGHRAVGGRSGRLVNIMQTVFISAVMSPQNEMLGLLMQRGDDELEVLRFGPYCLIPGRRLLLAGQDRIELGSRAFDILVVLVRRRGEVVSPRQLF